jgi:hypothetical protein
VNPDPESFTGFDWVPIVAQRLLGSLALLFTDVILSLRRVQKM